MQQWDLWYKGDGAVQNALIISFFFCIVIWCLAYLESLKKIYQWSMPCIPSSFSLFISNPVSHSCNTKRFLASFTHYTCIRVLLLSLVPFSFLGFFFYALKHLSAALSCSAHLFSSTLLFQGPEGASQHYFCFLLSLWCITPFYFLLCMRECMTISLIHSTGGAHWVQWPTSTRHTSNSHSRSHVFLCDDSQRHTSKDPEHQRRHPDCSWYPAEDHPYTRGGKGTYLSCLFG